MKKIICKLFALLILGAGIVFFVNSPEVSAEGPCSIEMYSCNCDANSLPNPTVCLNACNNYYGSCVNDLPQQLPDVSEFRRCMADRPNVCAIANIVPSEYYSCLVTAKAECIKMYGN